MWKRLIDIIFPEFCLFCNREGNLVCYDCLSQIPLVDKIYCSDCLRIKNCNERKLIISVDPKNRRIKKMINRYINPPYLKNLSNTFVQISKYQFELLDIDIQDSYFVPLPSDNKDFDYNKRITDELNKYSKSKDHIYLTGIYFKKEFKKIKRDNSTFLCTTINKNL